MIAWDEENNDEDLSEEQKIEKKKQDIAIREIYKNEDSKSLNLYIKAGTAGALETVLKECNKILANNERISIINTGVGSFTESELETAL